MPSRASAMPASPCSSSSRTPPRRCACPTVRTSWKAVTSHWPAEAPTCSTIPACALPTWGSDMADGPDLVIAGAGGGLVAAIRAAQLGLSVLVVEASEHFTRGNNTAMSTAVVPGAGTRWQTEAGLDDSPDLFVDDILAKTHGEADVRLARALAGVSGRLVTWLADDVALSMSLVTDFQYPGHTRLRCHTIPGR